MPETTPAAHKTEKIGQVLPSKMDKTIVVEVIRRVPHPIYKRIITKRKKFYAHDENNTARAGDTVRIVESHPLSRLKRWTLGEVLRRAVDVGSVDLSGTEKLKSVKKEPAKAAKKK